MRTIVVYLLLIVGIVASAQDTYYDSPVINLSGGSGEGGSFDTSSLVLDTTANKVITLSPIGLGYNTIGKFGNTTIPKGTYDTAIVNLALWNSICRALTTYRLNYNDTTLGLFISTGGLFGIGTKTPLGKLNIDSRTGTDNDIWLQNGSTSGVTTTDGFRIRFGSDRKVSLWNFENAAIEMATNNILRLTISSDGIVSSTSGRVIKIQSIASAASTTVLTTADHFVCVTGSTTHTLTLPAAATGQILIIKNRSSGDVTVNKAGSNTIDGGTSTTLTTGQSITLIANGSDWTIN
jgi:hypothetical protein